MLSLIILILVKALLNGTSIDNPARDGTGRGAISLGGQAMRANQHERFYRRHRRSVGGAGKLKIAASSLPTPARRY